MGKSSILAAILIGCVLAIYSLATPALSQQGNRVQQLDSISYAQLTIKGNEVTWDPGGNEISRTDTLNVTYRRLGGNQRATLVNLLNVIGSDGWDLVQIENNVWTFKR